MKIELTWNKLKHFYFNKYIVSLFKKKRYYISYDFEHKALWIRTYKTGSRTINNMFKENCRPKKYIYSSEVAFLPCMYKNYFKFTFVRNPESRLISAWKDKVLHQNYFKFDEKTHEAYKTFENFLSYVETLDVTSCDQHLMSLNALIDFDNIDFVGKLENFDEDATYVANKLGIHYEPKTLNKTKKVDLELTPDQRKRIYKIYQDDFELLYPDHKNDL